MSQTYRSPLFRVALDGYIGWRFDEEKLRKIIRDHALAIQTESKSLLAGSTGAGRKYFLPGGGVYHASLPGALPANRTGFLADSILARIGKRDGLKAWIGPSRGSFKAGEFYPEFLTSGRDHMERRLSATALAARRHRARFNRAVAKAMETAIKPGAPA